LDEVDEAVTKRLTQPSATAEAEPPNTTS